MKTLLPAPALLFLFAAACPAAVVFSDNFDSPDTGNLDNSDLTGRSGGLLAGEVQIRSGIIQHGISGNQLLMGTAPWASGRIRFHDISDLNWTNFASGAAGAAILGDGGLRVAFDWIPANNTNDNWLSWSAGISGAAAGEPSIRVLDSGTDFGILFRHNGGTQYFDNGMAVTGGEFAATAGARHVVMDFRFSSFADGSDVVFSASVDGAEVLGDYVFQWEENSEVLHMELGTLESGQWIDNFSISTIPEPSAILLTAGAAVLPLLRRRRTVTA